MKQYHTVKKINPSDIRPRFRADLNNLMSRSLRADFADRDKEEITGLVARRDQTRRNPNRAIDGIAFRRKQTFANVMGVALLAGEKPVMYVTTADNASSKSGGPLGVAVRRGKLHLEDAFNKDWIGHRYRWLGMCSIDPCLRSADTESGLISDPALIDKFMSAVVNTAHPDQPLSAYPSAEETAFKSMLISKHFGPDGSTPEPTRMFGHGTAPVELERWVAAPRGS